MQAIEKIREQHAKNKFFSRFKGVKREFIYDNASLKEKYILELNERARKMKLVDLKA
jgi:hypothetical protein